ncbi:MAG: DUF3788 family protein [Bacteroidota bacterium]
MEEQFEQDLPEDPQADTDHAEDMIAGQSPFDEGSTEIDTLLYSDSDSDSAEIESSFESEEESDSAEIEQADEITYAGGRSENEQSRWARRKGDDAETRKPAVSLPESDDDEIEFSREVRSERERTDQDSPRNPFNNQKHAPTRPEIDILQGVAASAELRRFEHQLELMEPMINWAMQWYENETGWGFRASYRARVLCVLHFYRGFFTVTMSIPITDIERYHSLKELTPGLQKAFDYFTHSTKMKWFVFHVRTSKEVRAVLAMLQLKLEDLKKKTSRG